MISSKQIIKRSVKRSFLLREEEIRLITTQKSNSKESNKKNRVNPAVSRVTKLIKILIFRFRIRTLTNPFPPLTTSERVLARKWMIIFSMRSRCVLKHNQK